MDRETGFRIIFFAAFAVLLAIRAYFRWRLRRAGEAGWRVGHDAAHREGRGGIIWRLLVFIYMLAALIIYAVDPVWLSRFAVALPPWSRWLGTGAAVLSLAFLIWVHYALGKQWSANLELREEHILITGGPYRFIRHPMYSALMGLTGGLALVSANWTIIVLAVLASLLLYARTGKEEAMMLENFGDSYRAYMKSTGRLLPRLGRNSAHLGCG